MAAAQAGGMTIRYVIIQGKGALCRGCMVFSDDTTPGTLDPMISRAEETGLQATLQVYSLMG